MARNLLSRPGSAWRSSAHIAAYSLKARGRSERAFCTLEDRLPKELTLAGITDIEGANAWLLTTYLPAHNRLASAEARPKTPVRESCSMPCRNHFRARAG